MACGVSVDDLKNIFNAMDKDGSGQLDLAEVVAVCVQMRKGDEDAGKADAYWVMKDADKEGKDGPDGKISWDEFLAAVQKRE